MDVSGVATVEEDDGLDEDETVYQRKERAWLVGACDEHLCDLQRRHPTGIPGPDEADYRRARAIRDRCN